MKIVLSALVMALALTQVAEAKKKIPVTETKTEKTRPLLDQTATGGIVPSANPQLKNADPGQAYPPPLDIHF